MSFFLVFTLLITYFVWIQCIFYRHRRNFVNSVRHMITFSSSRENQFLASRTDDVRALIVTAHPDDECMFFAPTILRLVELNASVHLLCLSEGNYYNQGLQRKKELLNSCAVLGIPASRVSIVNHKATKITSTLVFLLQFMLYPQWLSPVRSQVKNAQNLPDDPRAEWSISLVSCLLKKHIHAHSFNMVLTFDGRGVSGHVNHIAIHNAVSHLASTGEVPDDCHLMSLMTVGLLRKYLSFLEIPISWLLPACFSCIIGPEGYRKAREAMFSHRTQLLWFRYLYIMFSRYMLINTFQMIPQGPRNLKIY